MSDNSSSGNMDRTSDSSNDIDGNNRDDGMDNSTGRPRATRNPAKAAFYTTGAAGAVMLAPGILIGAFLPILGFTSAGIAAASLAAGWQATIGNVVAGSFFAMVQSLAAGGGGILAIAGQIMTAVAGIGAAIAGAVGSWFSFFWWKR